MTEIWGTSYCEWNLQNNFKQMCFQTTTSLWSIFFEVMVLTLVFKLNWRMNVHIDIISNIFIPLSICLPTNVGHQWPGQPGEDSKIHVAKNIGENTFFHQLLFRNSRTVRKRIMRRTTARRRSRSSWATSSCSNSRSTTRGRSLCSARSRTASTTNSSQVNCGFQILTELKLSNPPLEMCSPPDKCLLVLRGAFFSRNRISGAVRFMRAAHHAAEAAVRSRRPWLPLRAVARADGGRHPGKQYAH